MPEVLVAPSGRRSRRRTVLYAAATLVASGVAVWVTSRIAGDFGKALTAMGRFDTHWLALAGLCEVAGLILTGEAIWRLQGRPAVITRPVAQAASLVHLGLGPVMPAAPVEGWTLSFLELRRRGLPQRRAGLALAWGLWLQARSFVLLGVISALAVVAAGELTGRLALYAVLGACGAGIYLAVAWLLTNRPRLLATIGGAAARVLPVPVRPEQVRAGVHELHAEAHDLLGHGRRRALSWVLVGVGPLAAGAALWCILEAGSHPLSIQEALLAGVLTVLASMVPVLPGGIGVAESTLTLVLHHFGVPLSEGLAAALVWRGMTLVGPAVAGVLALGSLRAQRVRPAPAG